jgi:uncharacterized repeat protein (TIGR03803 family)
MQRAACVLAAAAFGASTCAAARSVPLREAFQRHVTHARSHILYSFRGGRKDGALPAAGLVADKTGALYGTTQAGGAKNRGTVFKLTPSGPGYTESVLYGFQGGQSDGAWLVAGLIEDKSGALYGTTLEGGVQNDRSGCTVSPYKGCGTVFKLTPSASGHAYQENILYGFSGYAHGYDGFWPYGGLIADKTGALYGTTQWGGSSASLGTVFKLTPTGTGYTEAIVYTFPLSSSGPSFPDGTNPAAGLLADDSGALYGTTELGGTGACPGFPTAGCGVVFKLTPSGSGYALSVLHSFQSGNDGWWPLAGLIQDASGALYGTTEYGGAANDGTVFKLTPSTSGYSESILHAFDGNDGALPLASLTLDRGALYGTTSSGGNANQGTIFTLTPSGSSYSVLYAFQGGSDGAEPLAGLTRGKAGMLYGTTMTGGASGAGTVFALKP